MILFFIFRKQNHEIQNYIAVWNNIVNPKHHHIHERATNEKSILSVTMHIEKLGIIVSPFTLSGDPVDDKFLWATTVLAKGIQRDIKNRGACFHVTGDILYFTKMTLGMWRSN